MPTLWDGIRTSRSITFVLPEERRGLAHDGQLGFQFSDSTASRAQLG